MTKSHFSHFPKQHMLAISATLLVVVIALFWYEKPSQRKKNSAINFA